MDAYCCEGRRNLSGIGIIEMGKPLELTRMNVVSTQSGGGTYNSATIIQPIDNHKVKKHTATVIKRQSHVTVIMCEYLFDHSSWLFQLLPDNVYMICTPCHECTCCMVSLGIETK